MVFDTIKLSAQDGLLAVGVRAVVLVMEELGRTVARVLKRYSAAGRGGSTGSPVAIRRETNMRGSKARRAISLICGTSLILIIGSDTGFAAESVAKSRGQTVYATAYSYVRMGAGEHKFPVTAMLVVRNLDTASAIVVTTVDYRDSKGGHLHHYVEEPVVVGPLASAEFFVKESEMSGGHTPSFIVRWEANSKVNAPVVETLMISGRGGQGISFVGRAWIIEEAGDRQGEGEPRGLAE